MLSVSVYLKSGRVIDSLTDQLHQDAKMLSYVENNGKAYRIPIDSIEYIECEDVEDDECNEEKRKPCINYEDGCEEWAGCPCVYYKTESEPQESEVEDGKID